MSTAIVTLIMIITSDTTVSARTQRMTFAECRAEMRNARDWLKSDERLDGGCILTPGQESKFRGVAR